MTDWWKKLSAWFGNLCPGYRDEMRYMVRATDGEGKDFVVGWSTLRSGGTPMRIVKEHPEWHSPIVFDTKEGVLG